MNHCGCTGPHEPRRIVLTGGPGAGKTAVLELIRRTLCEHVQVVPESAGIVFGGGFPRGTMPAVRRPAQRAIFYVQRELEEAMTASGASIMLCDRGTIDGQAYWPGEGDLWSSVGSTLEAQLARYHAVIHLRVPPPGGGYNHDNPLRIESPAEAALIDARIADVWRHHPRYQQIPATPDFLVKVARTLDVLRAELPACCRGPASPFAP